MEIKTHTYGQLIFNKNVKIVQWGKVFFINDATTLISTCRIINFDPCTTPYTKQLLWLMSRCLLKASYWDVLEVIKSKVCDDEIEGYMITKLVH